MFPLVCAGYSTAGLQDRVGASGSASDSEEENDDVFRTSETGPPLDPSKDLELQDEDQEEGEDENEDDEEYVVSVGKRMKVKEVAMQAPGSRERKKPKLEGTSTQTAKKRAPRRRVEKDDEEFIVGDDEAIDGRKRATAPSATRKTSHSKPKTSTTATAGPSSNTKDVTLVDAQAPIEVPDAPPTDRVRAHVVKQLHTIFLSIFTASTEVPPEYHSNEDRAISFATDVEGDLFQGFAEVDLKAHVRGPRAKYSSKFHHGDDERGFDEARVEEDG
ncbi:BZ3500_MvSof-1268-A1-R1_Chr2-1g04253 [Microbotryum saponariae]|uniref:BZ3500_MvSof-1268-A1-R1_Chr2-1g04253 protein n=1 Tax=Microbotryum saponariae TaxID=289078 RepID=A0A2X0MAU8_9BASI|nr:BZ3500_MvSof-1268-A1-R1_Chr2-1g04253 [Microbotryum saponariae]SCZ91240.1 BZ3501_MvSof-1269-A2-R1_Chr2-1g03909 [Microbotryum saponariae]